jgi:hypothetical protein
VRNVLGVLVILIAAVAHGQALNPSMIFMAGPSYNPSGSPQVAGTFMSAYAINTVGTYGFTIYDATPSGTDPFTVHTSVGIGMAQRVSSLGQVGLYMPTGAAVDYTGDNVGWAWTTGLGAAIPLTHHMLLMPTIRTQKSSVGNGQGIHLIYGVMFGGWR